MTIFETLKELFQLQSEKIKDLINNLVKNQEKLIDDLASKYQDLTQELKEKFVNYDEKFIKVQEKISRFDSIEIDDFKNQINEVKNKLNQIDIDKIRKEFNEKIKNLTNLFGLDLIDPDKIKDAKSIDDALKDKNLKITNPTQYQFLQSNFNKIKDYFN